jgi:hypothetical protein
VRKRLSNFFVLPPRAFPIQLVAALPHNPLRRAKIINQQIFCANFMHVALAYRDNINFNKKGVWHYAHALHLSDNSVIA